MDIELTIFDSLPINSLAVMKRIEDILRENKTNSIHTLKGEALARAQACILILWEQSKLSWDVYKEWVRVRDELKPHHIAEKLGK